MIWWLVMPGNVVFISEELVVSQVSDGYMHETVNSLLWRRGLQSTYTVRCVID